MRQLIFVYNAKSDPANMLIDYAHKFIRPSTYACDLCKLTHSNLGVNKVWNKFLKKSSFKIDFLYSDEFEDQFGVSFHYPTIFEKSGKEFNTLLSNTEIAKLRDIGDLINAIQDIK